MMLEQFEDKVVFIKDAEMLEEVRQFLESKQQMFAQHFFLSEDQEDNYLYYDINDDAWGLSNKLEGCDGFNDDVEITFEELKQMLNKL